jgi:uncharacterized protein YfdQ (DUF2303 family)
VVGAKNAKRDVVEVKLRKTGAVVEVAAKDIESHLKALLKTH